MNVRQNVMARQDADIEASSQRALVAKERKSALQKMAERYDIGSGQLKQTLLNTVFRNCNEAEFMALCIVANGYGLNPLTKEIYAFAAKGGGIVPMVSIDGWLRIMNEHPDFDGIEHNYIYDQKGGLEAVEAIIYHKRRSHPIKVTEFLSECKRNTEPWKMEHRMMRHRATIQCARYAFGFAGIYAEGDVVEGEFSVVGDAVQSILPNAEDFQRQNDQGHDPDTGEVLPTDPQTGMTEVDEDAARELDAGPDDAMYDEAEANAQAMDGPLPEGTAPNDQPAWLSEVRTLRVAIANAKTLKALDAVEREWINRVLNMVTEESVARSVDNDIATKRRELKVEQG